MQSFPSVANTDDVFSDNEFSDASSISSDAASTTYTTPEMKHDTPIVKHNVRFYEFVLAAYTYSAYEYDRAPIRPDPLSTNDVMEFLQFRQEMNDAIAKEQQLLTMMTI